MMKKEPGQNLGRTADHDCTARRNGREGADLVHSAQRGPCRHDRQHEYLIVTKSSPDHGSFVNNDINLRYRQCSRPEYLRHLCSLECTYCCPKDRTDYILNMIASIEVMITEL